MGKNENNEYHSITSQLQSKGAQENEPLSRNFCEQILTLLSQISIASAKPLDQLSMGKETDEKKSFCS